MNRKRIATIVAGLSLAWITLTMGLYQINEMMMAFVGYEKLNNYLWVPGLGLNALLCFEIFWILAFSSLPIAITTWYLARR